MPKSMLVALVGFALVGCTGSQGDAGPSGPSGSGGVSTLVRIDEGSVDAHCTHGGIRVLVGHDADGSGELEDGEVESTRFICNGDDGDSLLVTSAPATGCDGVLLSWGVDANGDGVLDPAERSGSASICDGEPGAVQVLTPVAAGDDCAAGGFRLALGRDTNGDGLLGDDEIEGTALLCNGVDGVDGRDSLIRQTKLKAGSAECPNGGIRFDSGIDLDRDGVLGDEEVSTTNAICNDCKHPGSRNCTSATVVPVNEITVSFRPGEVDAGDLDGDGILDLVFRDQDGTHHYAAIGKGDGTFAIPVEVDGGESGQFRLGDFDGDGHLDIAGCSGWFLPGNGDGSFGEAVAWSGLSFCAALEVLDFDGDGVLDLVGTGTGTRFWKGNGDGTFTTFEARIESGRAIVAGDLDGDGFPDITWTDDKTPIQTPLMIAWSDGLGGIRKVEALGQDNFLFRGLAVGDLDGDGVMDLAHVTSGGIKTRLGVAGGAPQSSRVAATLSPSFIPMAIMLADVNGDGSLDLVSVDNYGTLSIFLGNGDGTFAARQTAATPGEQAFLHAADFNDDGKLDFVVSVLNERKLVILLGD